LIDIARARGLDMVTVAYRDGGLDFETLDAIATDSNPHLFYVMPTFHNPTGALLPANSRRRLLAWCERRHIPILEDGVYDGLWYNNADIQPLKAMDEQGEVLYASGFSKTVAPGSRIGYLLAGERMRGQIMRVKQTADVSTPGLHQRAMALLISDGSLMRHLEAVRKACQARRDVFLMEWQSLFSDWHYRIPQGGLYLWATMPLDGPDAKQLAAQAQGLGVDFALGTDFSPNHNGEQNYTIRLNFTTHPLSVMKEGLNRLKQAYLGIKTIRYGR